MNDDAKWEGSINDYEDTIFAMLGFANFYRYDDDSRQMRPGVSVMQGWRFTPIQMQENNEASPEAVTPVTPDLAILLEAGDGVVAEVKKSFPMDKTLWMTDFEQLMRYDAELDGWPCASGRVSSHDIVLLVHQSRARRVTDYYREQSAADKVRFVKPFVIVEFNRSAERQPYFFFRTFEGKLSETTLDSRLHDGVPVPMIALVGQYSMVKLYDGPPPMPYLLHIIWQEIITPKVEAKKPLNELRRRQKVEVIIDADDLTNELRDKFSFKALFGGDHPRQPKVPAREWVRAACDQLIAGKLADWVESSEGVRLKVYFQRMDDVLAAFKNMCSKPSTGTQGVLFAEAVGEGPQS
jgi:hypothetical protein